MTLVRRAAAIGGSWIVVMTASVSTLSAQRTESGRMSWDGLDRTFTVRIPRRADATSTLPLLILLHGRGGNGSRFAQRSGFDAKADAEGFLLVAPDGTGDPRGWHTGFASGGAIDDVGFIGALIDTLSHQYAVDRARVYIVGYSNGGALAHRLAADLSSRIAAAAVVAGAIGARWAGDRVARIDTPRAPVAMLIMHGDADDIVPYEAANLSAHVGRPIPAPEGARFWARANECALKQSRRDTLATGRVVRETWDSRCRTPVVFFTVRGGDHGWPRADRGAPIDATDVIWDFFAQQRR